MISALKENRFQIASQITPLQNTEDLHAAAFKNNTDTAKQIVYCKAVFMGLVKFNLRCRDIFKLRKAM